MAAWRRMAVIANKISGAVMVVTAYNVAANSAAYRLWRWLAAKA